MMMEEDVQLAEYTDEEFVKAMTSGMKYPCLVISGLTTEEELTFFRKREYSEEVSLPLYCEMENVPYEIGKMELSFDSLLALRVIADYDLKLYRSAQDVIQIDLNDPITLLKFIRL